MQGIIRIVAGEILQIIRLDTSVDKFASLVTCKYKPLENEGVWEEGNIERRNFMAFPLDYMAGRTSDNGNELTLSWANVGLIRLNKRTGDNMWICVEKQKYKMVVAGILICYLVAPANCNF